MYKHQLLVVIALTLGAVTATHAFAAGQDFYAQQYDYGGQQPTVVVLDGRYAEEHPVQRGLQGDAVVTRERVSQVEQVNAQQWAAINANRQQTVVVVEQPQPVVAPVSAAPGAPAPNVPPSGANNPPATPADGRATMPPTFWEWVVALVILAALGVGGYLVCASFATANEDNIERRRIRRQGLQTAADRNAVGVIMDELDDVTAASPDGVGERYSISVSTSNGRIHRSGRIRPGGTAAVPGTPGTPGAPAATPTPAEVAARAALTRATRLNASPAIAAGQAQALGAILLALGTDVTDDAACDAVAAANPTI